MPKEEGHRPYDETVEDHWSPNQLAKRKEIVDAAAMVLLSEGVAACTARAIAQASPLTTSALHYYFTDVDEIVDLAFAKVMHGFLDRVEEAANSCEDPVEALWAAASRYFEHGRTTGRATPGRAAPRAPFIWFEYQIMRKAPSSVASEVMERAAKLFKNLVIATGIPDAKARGDLLFLALLGATVKEALTSRETNEILKELGLATGLPVNEQRRRGRPRAG
jgi:AcrR family transcriptional regulator